MNSHPQIMPVNLYRKAPAARIVSVNVAQHYADIAVNETLFIYGILAEVTVAEAGGTVAIADSTFIERTVFTGSGKNDLTTGGVFTGGTHLDYVVTIDGVERPILSNGRTTAARHGMLLALQSTSRRRL